MGRAAAPLKHWALMTGSALILAACAGSGTAPDDDAASTVSESPSTATAVTTSSTPTATFPTEPVAIGPATLVSGTADCVHLDFGPLTTDEDGGEHGREGSANCTYTMNDPRVTGRTTDTWSVDAWTSEQGESVLVQWGTTRLETDEGGVWEGTYSGSYNEHTGDSISFWYRGTGAYEGLAFHAMFTGLPPWDMKGIIYPGDLPELP